MIIGEKPIAPVSRESSVNPDTPSLHTPLRERSQRTRLRMAAVLATTSSVIVLASACGNNPADPNTTHERNDVARSPFGVAMKAYGYTDINISGNSIGGKSVRFGGGSCPSSQGECHGYAEFVHYNDAGKVWADGNGDYGCAVPSQYSAFDQDSHAHQLDILQVADSSQTATAADAAKETAKQHGQQLGHFEVTYDSIAWDCFPKDY